MKDEEKRNLKVVQKALPKGTACSFCGKSKDEARALIAGDSAFICDECVARAEKLMRQP